MHGKMYKLHGGNTNDGFCVCVYTFVWLAFEMRWDETHVTVAI